MHSEQANTVGIIEPNILYVSQNGDADYITISEAVANAKRGIIIIINPGVYDETVDIVNKEITLLGTDREICIIPNTTGRYCNSPLVAGGDFKIENLMLKMTVENVGDWEPTYISVIWSVAAYVFYKMYGRGNNIFVSAFVCAGVAIWVTIFCAVMLKKADDTFIGQRVRQIVSKKWNR